MHHWGKDTTPDSLASPGCTVSPFWKEVAYIVNQRACTYNAPVKSCPTADNVMVDCDLNLIFKVGPKPEDVKKFVYRLGARRFDEFLFASVEEGIRHLIRSCIHTEVYELRHNDTRVRETLSELNRKFKPFGVTFEQAAITDVTFKSDLQTTLQNTTEYDSKIEEEEKKQGHLMDRLIYQEDRDLKTLQKTCNISIQKMLAHQDRLKIERETRIVQAEANRSVTLVKSETAASVASIKAKSQLEAAKNQGLKNKEEAVADATAESAARKIREGTDNRMKVYTSDVDLKNEENRQKAVMEVAEAEEYSASRIQAQREHALKMAQMEVLATLAANSDIVISGEMGNRIMETMLADNILGTIKLGQ